MKFTNVMSAKMDCGSVVSNNKAASKAAQEDSKVGPGTKFGYPYDDFCYATYGSGNIRTEPFVEGKDEDGNPIELTFEKNINA